MKQWPRIPIFLAVALVFLLTGQPALAKRYELATEGKSQVVFISKAPLETFEGKTDKISGWFEADLSDLSGSIDLEIKVQLAGFDTGKKKRNQHMRENHLETEIFPAAYFRAGQIVSAQPSSLTAGGHAAVVISGVLDLHGVQQQRSIELKLTLTKENSLRVRGSFPVLLSDHDIKRPKFLVMKLADEQLVEIDLLAKPVS